MFDQSYAVLAAKNEVVGGRKDSHSQQQHIGMSHLGTIEGSQLKTLHIQRQKFKKIAEAKVSDVCFSNRPFWVKHFQTVPLLRFDVARGLALLFGLGTRALPSWDSKTRRNNLLGDLAVKLTAGSSALAKT
jgi:hypothetical protein